MSSGGPTARLSAADERSIRHQLARMASPSARQDAMLYIQVHYGASAAPVLRKCAENVALCAMAIHTLSWLNLYTGDPLVAAELDDIMANGGKQARAVLIMYRGMQVSVAEGVMRRVTS